MVRRTPVRLRRLTLAGIFVILGAWLAVTSPSGADVTAGSATAYGYFLDATVPITGHVVRGPAPVSTFPPGGTQTLGATTVVAGPATVFSFSSITATTNGATGANGFVTASVDISNINTSQQEVFTASAVHSECRADESGVTGSATITGGTLQTDNGLDLNNDGNYTDPGEHPPTSVTVVNPAPNTVVQGHIHIGDITDNFSYTFNEQMVNADGSITVNAAHQRFLGPATSGDLIIGHVDCGVTVAATTTSSSTTSTSTPTSTSSSTTSTSTPTSSSSSTTSTSTPTSTSSSTTSPSSSTTSTSTSTSTPTSTSTTMAPGTSTTTSTPGLPPSVRALVCSILQRLASTPFFRPFLQPLLVRFGCV